MNPSVIVLNADYSFLGFEDWNKALIKLNNNKAEIFKLSNTYIYGYNNKFQVPLAIRLKKLIRAVYRHKVPYSRKNILIRDRFQCQYCGKQFSRHDRKILTIDHIIPVCRGGKDTWENCVCSCQYCNIIVKEDKLPSEAGLKLIKRPIEPTINEFTHIKLEVLGLKSILEDLFNDNNLDMVINPMGNTSINHLF